MPVQSSAVELFGGPCDGRRMVVRDDDHCLAVYAEDVHAAQRKYVYARSLENFKRFTLVRGD